MPTMTSALVIKPGRHILANTAVLEFIRFLEVGQRLSTAMKQELEIYIQNGKVKKDAAAIIVSISKTMKTFGAVAPTIEQALQAATSEIQTFFEERNEDARTKAKQAPGTKGSKGARRARSKGLRRDEVRKGGRAGKRSLR